MPGTKKRRTAATNLPIIQEEVALDYTSLKDSAIVVNPESSRKKELTALNQKGSSFSSIDITQDFIKAEDLYDDAVETYKEALKKHNESISKDYIPVIELPGGYEAKSKGFVKYVDSHNKNSLTKANKIISSSIAQRIDEKNIAANSVILSISDYTALKKYFKDSSALKDTQYPQLRLIKGNTPKQKNTPLPNPPSLKDILEAKIKDKLEQHPKFQNFSTTLKRFFTSVNAQIVLAEVSGDSLDIGVNTSDTPSTSTIKSGLFKEKQIPDGNPIKELNDQFNSEEKARQAFLEKNGSSKIPKFSEIKSKTISSQDVKKAQEEINNLCKAEYLQRLYPGLYAVQNLSVDQHESQYLTKAQKEQIFATDIDEKTITKVLSSFNASQRPELLNRINAGKIEGKITNFQLLDILAKEPAWKSLGESDTGRDTQSSIEISLSGKMLSSAQNDIFTEFEAMLDQIATFDAKDPGWKRSKGVVAFDTGQGKSFLVDDIIYKYNDLIKDFFDKNESVKNFFETHNGSQGTYPSQTMSSDLTNKIQELKAAESEAGTNKTIQEKAQQELETFKQIAQDPGKYLKQYQLYQKGFEIININLANKEELEKNAEKGSLHGKVIIIDEAIFIDDYAAQIRSLVDKGAKVIAVGATLSYPKTLEDIQRKTDKIPSERELQDCRDELKQLLESQSVKGILSVEAIQNRKEELNERIDELEREQKDDEYKDVDSYSRKTKMAEDNLSAIKERRSKTESRITKSIIPTDSKFSEVTKNNWTDLVSKNSEGNGKTQNIIPGLKLTFAAKDDKENNNAQLKTLAKTTGKLVVANFIENGKHRIALVQPTEKGKEPKIEFYDAGSEAFKKAVEGISGSDEAIMIYAGNPEFIVGGDYSNLSVLGENDKQNIFLSKKEHVNIDLIKQMIGRDRSGSDDIPRNIICSQNIQANIKNPTDLIQQATKNVKDKEIEGLLGNLKKKITKRMPVLEKAESSITIQKDQSNKLEAITANLSPKKKQSVISGTLILDPTKLNQTGATEYFKKASVVANDILPTNVGTDPSAESFSTNSLRPTDCKLTDISNIVWNDEDHASSSYKLNRDLRSYIFWESIEAKKETKKFDFNEEEYKQILLNPKDYGLDAKFVKEVNKIQEKTNPAIDEKFIDLAFKIAHCEKTTFAKRRDFLQEVKNAKLQELQQQWDWNKTKDLLTELTTLQNVIDKEVTNAKEGLANEQEQKRVEAAENLKAIEGKRIGEETVEELLKKYQDQITTLDKEHDAKLTNFLNKHLQHINNQVGSLKDLGQTIVQQGSINVEEANTKLAAIDAEKQSANARASQAEQNLSALKSDVDSALSQNSTLQAQNAQLRVQLATTGKEKSTQAERIQTLEEERNAQEVRHNQELANTHSSQGEKEQKLQSDLRVQVANNTELKGKLIEAEAKTSELTSRLEQEEARAAENQQRLSKANSQLKEKNTELDDQLRPLIIQVLNISQENKTFKDQIKLLTDKTTHNAALSEVAQQLQDRQNFAQAYDVQADVLKRLETQKNELENAAQTNLTQIQETLQQGYDSKMQTLQSEHSAKLEAIKQKHQEQEQKLKKDSDEYKANNDKLATELAEATDRHKAEVESLTKDKNDAVNKCEALKEELKKEQEKYNKFTKEISQINESKSGVDSLQTLETALNKLQRAAPRTPSTSAARAEQGSPTGIMDLYSPTKPGVKTEDPKIAKLESENTALKAQLAAKQVKTTNAGTLSVAEQEKDTKIKALQQQVTALRKAEATKTANRIVGAEVAGENVFHKMRTTVAQETAQQAATIAALKAAATESQRKHTTELAAAETSSATVNSRAAASETDKATLEKQLAEEQNKPKAKQVSTTSTGTSTTENEAKEKAEQDAKKEATSKELEEAKAAAKDATSRASTAEATVAESAATQTKQATRLEEAEKEITAATSRASSAEAAKEASDKTAAEQIVVLQAQLTAATRTDQPTSTSETQTSAADATTPTTPGKSESEQKLEEEITRLQNTNSASTSQFETSKKEVEKARAESAEKDATIAQLRAALEAEERKNATSATPSTPTAPSTNTTATQTQPLAEAESEVTPTVENRKRQRTNSNGGIDEAAAPNGETIFTFTGNTTPMNIDPHTGETEEVLTPVAATSTTTTPVSEEQRKSAAHTIETAFATAAGIPGGGSGRGNSSGTPAPRREESINQSNNTENPEWFANNKIARVMNKLHAIKSTLNFDQFIVKIDSIQQEGTSMQRLKDINNELFQNNNNFSLTMADISVLDQMDDINRKLVLDQSTSKATNTEARTQLKTLWEAYDKSTSADDIAKILTSNSARLPENSQIQFQGTIDNVENAPIFLEKKGPSTSVSAFKISNLKAGLKDLSPAEMSRVSGSVTMAA